MTDAQLMWGLFSISATGFFFLAGAIWWVSRQLPDARKIAKDLGDIKDALIGTINKPGYISLLHDVKKDVDEMKEKINQLSK